MDAVEILLIEDDDIDATFLEKAFVDVWPDAHLVRVEDGERGLEILDEFSPNLILLDLMLPGLSGLNTLTEIKRRDALLGVPVIVCSGSDARRDVVNSYKYHANAYVVKPQSPAGYRKLVRSIKDFWEKRRSLVDGVLNISGMNE